MTWGFEQAGAAADRAVAEDEGMQEAARHIPVMRDEIVRAIVGDSARSGLRLVDLTVGLGGHAAAVLKAAPADTELLGLDRDAEALSIARRTLADFGSRVHLVQSRFATLPQEVSRLGWKRVDGVLGDLGVSSLQLDDSARGFSFRQDAPLDMRMDQAAGETAADLLERLDEETLTRVLRELGEEPAARRIARAICRSDVRPQTTAELQALVSRVAGGPRKRRRRINPATLTFQGLRIAVNEEIEELDALLEALPELLADDARVVFLAYHSLEDRRIKNRFRSWTRACTCPPEIPICRCGGIPRARSLMRKAGKAPAEEIAANPRARSARLRAIAWGAGDGS